MASSIENYGLIGDSRTAALCSLDGSIDWLCLPRFDSVPVFSSLVGGGGRFVISPRDAKAARRRYRTERSAVLETTWQTPRGEIVLTDGMVSDLSSRLLPQALLVRRVEAAGDEQDVTVQFDPSRWGAAPNVRRYGGRLVCAWGSLALGIQPALEPGRITTIRLKPGSPLTIVLCLADRQPVMWVEPDVAWRMLLESDRWWCRWAGEIQYDGPFANSVVRSLLTLRLLSFAPTAAPVAAPTTSLPEDPGGARNWDYRYAWPRDASIGIRAFLGGGKTEEASAFMRWLLYARRLSRGRVYVAYTLYGKPVTEETEVPGAQGYLWSRPVREGNSAAKQHQLDTYGWILDAGWLLDEALHGLDAETWRALASLADTTALHWREPDAGIWEVRDRTAQHVHSKIWGWMALDRALRLARTRHVRPGRLHRWERARSAIAREVRERGWNAELRAYTRTYDSADLDASLLLLPVTGFEGPWSPRLRSTTDAILRGLGAGGSLLFRYTPGSDDLPGADGAFLPCSFWAVQALALTGRLEEAEDLMSDLCAMSSDVGLYPEEVDPSTGSFLGNFPQALTHSSLVLAAVAIRDAQSRREALRTECAQQESRRASRGRS